jgi:hypothetical protein
MSSLKKRSLWSVIVLAILYVVLLIPNDESGSIYKAPTATFTWNRDSQWTALEQTYVEARKDTPGHVDMVIDSCFANLTYYLQQLTVNKYSSSDSIFTTIRELFFAVAPYVTVEQKHRQQFIDFYTTARSSIKDQSTAWDMNDRTTRNTLYTCLYGMRASVDEVLLQSHEEFAQAIIGKQVASVSPSAKLFGIEVRSGDLLVSRGGAEVSAFISRGNDYAGNFSHVALVYVDDKHVAYLIEAHIEKGLAVSSAAQYEADKKLRFMVLRPRADLPMVQNDPLFAHKAAAYMLQVAKGAHVPYDFKMDFNDSSEMFCSEVGSYAYRKNGLQLWKGLSSISQQGVVNWLHAFGVEHFQTQMPSDLEYDPQLSVVAEWRDTRALLKDHIDNAVMDALLDKANDCYTGKNNQQDCSKVSYTLWMLPIARVLKAYSVVLNVIGKVGPMPEGMTASQALRNQSFVTMHQELRKKIEPKVYLFIKEHRYVPPYWQIVAMAKEESK